MLKQWLNRWLSKTKPPACYCPVCNSYPTSFLPLSEYYVQQWQHFGFSYAEAGEMTPLDTYSCPVCGASDRERLYLLWIKQQIEQKRFAKGMSVLHFAPEEGLAKQLRNLAFFNYVSADLLMPNADFKEDITAMSFADAQFDFFICSHVLEHVDSDDKAISELYRILRKGGCGILMAPIIVGLDKTLEDTSITDVAERWRLFGQDDHIRLYAHNDYVNKIKQHGFSVAQLDMAYFGKSVFQSLGLKPTSILYIVTKNAAH